MLENEIYLSTQESSLYPYYNGNNFDGHPTCHKCQLQSRHVIFGEQQFNFLIAIVVINLLTIAYNHSKIFFVKDSFNFTSSINKFNSKAIYFS